jgi:hypothetical protein
MPFANTENINRFNLATKKTQFFDYRPGTHLVRILSASALRVETHWIHGANIKCLGEDCPICKNNLKLIMADSKNFRSSPDYIPAKKTFLVNVLDKTPVKICPVCGHANKAEAGKFSVLCMACFKKDNTETLLAVVQPVELNEVRVLSRGVEFFDQLNSLELSVLDEAKNPIPLNTYDIGINVTGKGKDMKPFVVPYPHLHDPVVVKEDDLYDLDSVTIKVTAEEMLDLQRGVSLKDIFTARGKQENDVDKDMSNSAYAEVAKRAQELFPE